MMNHTSFGKRLSEHSRGDYRNRGLVGCIIVLILPFACGVWATIAALNTDRTVDRDANAGLIVSVTVVAICVALFGIYLLLYFLSPSGLRRYKLEIYEHGFKLKTPFKTQTCLWSEISEVRPMLLTTPANRARTNPDEFREHGGTEYGGMYEVHKADGSKILVSRQYTDVVAIDEQLKKFCTEKPNW